MGVPLGFAAVAQCWAASRQVLTELPVWSVNAWWFTSAVLAALIGARCVADVRRCSNLSAEARDPILGPFVALTPILLMVYGPALGAYVEEAGRAVFLLGLVSLAALGAWLSGWWIVGDVRLECWHPGYLLPTAIGGLVAAGSGALLGYRTLAALAFGWGLISWVTIGSIALARLTLAAPLPPALTPSLAILTAPPAAAADAWLLMGGDARGPVVSALGGYLGLMVGVQVCLLPVFGRTPFGAGWWALVVSYSSVAAFALDWLARSSVPPHAQHAGAVAVLVAVSAGITVLAVRSTVALLPLAVAAVSGQRTGRPVALWGKGPKLTMTPGSSRPEKESRWPRWSR
jgi:tellurite resistance protein